MPTYIYLHQCSTVRLWGLSYRQRIERQFKNDDRVVLAASAEQIPAEAKVIVLDGQWLLDGRILQTLIDSEAGNYHAQAAGKTVAVITPSENIKAACDFLETATVTDTIAALPRLELEQQVSSVESRLRKLDPPLIMVLSDDNRIALEHALYGSAYKSVTDLVTKFAWPKPARMVTRWCAVAGLRPNHITGLGIILMLLAGILFYQGHYGWGLLAGWIMTFLDTVDGKLARVTITSSKLGNALDHGMDLIHPPFWYMVWGMGLVNHQAGWPFDLHLHWVYTLIFIAYTFGRFAEGCFEWIIGKFSLFTWRPFDSFNRLVTARRNPCMILLTAGWAVGRPDWGLYGVLAWTVFSTLLLWWRNLLAFFARRHGPLQSWMELANQGQSFSDFSLRVFAPHLLKSSSK
jgi:phosphatidylglycerophosphate synthase